MNEPEEQRHCADDCPVVDSFASAFANYVPQEVRMASAIKAIESGLSERTAAVKFDVPRTTLQRKKVAQMGHQAKTQSGKEVSEIAAIAKPKKKPSAHNDKRKALRRQCADAGIQEIDGMRMHNCSVGRLKKALADKGIEPDYTYQLESEPSTPSNTDGQLSPADQEEREYDTSSAEAVDDYCYPRLIASAQAAGNDSYAAALEACYKLKTVVRLAFNSPEPVWSGGQWGSLAGEIQTISGLIYQRSEEAFDEYLHNGLKDLERGE